MGMVHLQVKRPGIHGRSIKCHQCQFPMGMVHQTIVLTKENYGGELKVSIPYGHGSHQNPKNGWIFQTYQKSVNSLWAWFTYYVIGYSNTMSKEEVTNRVNSLWAWFTDIVWNMFLSFGRKCQFPMGMVHSRHHCAADI